MAAQWEAFVSLDGEAEKDGLAYQLALSWRMTARHSVVEVLCSMSCTVRLAVVQMSIGGGAVMTDANERCFRMTF